jgi:hypothetical protein
LSLGTQSVWPDVSKDDDKRGNNVHSTLGR